LNNSCDGEGNCSACPTGKYGNKCQYSVCDPTTTDCSNLDCSSCLNGACDSNGNCYGCPAGMTGNNCQGQCPNPLGTCQACDQEGNCTSCSHFHYGNTCSSMCKNCSYGCDVTGKCNLPPKGNKGKKLGLFRFLDW